jgi:hypothetical protein
MVTYHCLQWFRLQKAAGRGDWEVRNRCLAQTLVKLFYNLTQFCLNLRRFRQNEIGLANSILSRNNQGRVKFPLNPNN